MTRQEKIWEILEPPMIPTKAGRIVGWIIISIICASTLAIILESVPALYASYGVFFFRFEMLCLGIFATEYVLRLWACAVQQPRIPRWRYALKPMLVIDFLAFAPSLLWMFDINLAFLRLLRLVRIFKFTPYYQASTLLAGILRQAMTNLVMAIFAMTLAVMLAACVLHLLEARAQPDAFGSIPAAMWWAIVSLTTVGYGDVVPITFMGRVVGSVVIILGLGFLALPAGIFATSFIEFSRRRMLLQNEIDKLKDSKGYSSKQVAHIEKVRTYLANAEGEITSLDDMPGGKRQPRCPHCGKPIPKAISA